MSENCQDTKYCVEDIRDAVSIHTSQIEDACIDKDCVENLRVYLTQESQNALDHSTSAKVRSAELLHVYIDVEPVAYNRGHYSLDITFYYRIIGDTMVNCLRPCALCGLAVFSKRVVLCGGTSCAKVFSSRMHGRGGCSVPEAVVEVVDPIVLAARVQDVCNCCQCDPELAELPEEIRCSFDGDLVTSGETKRLYVTLGQFSTVRLERDAQFTIPVFDFTVPEKECCDDAGCEESPCDTFSRLAFPVDAFFPCRRGNGNGAAASCNTETKHYRTTR